MVGKKNWRVSIFGAGYVGAVSAGCLAKDGFKVVAVDPDQYKVKCISEGHSPIYEPGLADLIETGVENGLLTATSDYIAAINETDISFCCPGTPSREDGSLDTSYVKLVCEQIGVALRDKSEFHMVVMRSTILPGTVEDVVIPALEGASGRKVGMDFGLAYYPEFLREGTAIADYYSPGAIVFGQYEGDEKTVQALHDLCASVEVKPHVIPIRSAEIVKYTNNCWHAVKISFANEIGNLCKSVGIDSHVVMDVVCADTRLNISRAYMKPGFAYGGSCLPKDLRALRHFGKMQNVSTPVLDATVEANQYQLERAFRLVNRSGAKKIGLLGLTFKSDTDDLRESPLVLLAERLMGKGYELSIYDSNVSVNDHGGRNYISHLASFMRSSPEEVVSESEAIVVGINGQGTKDALKGAREGVKVIDLVRIPVEMPSGVHYEGLVW
ncbi:GDP-mannose 6-dehydrogenase [Rhizobium mongolense subsp. loessense]|uniref:UDP-glucose 6-dehydrogenase n=1 Tax=Rhizobium mongolense subsp. loessense TaxID=158890 RepID=A0A1G4RY09_9HYPH|nr:GDP-mannose 6-dehydrogenase [Rhizobium mongolense subsp. loessense]